MFLTGSFQGRQGFTMHRGRRLLAVVFSILGVMCLGVADRCAGADSATPEKPTPTVAPAQAPAQPATSTKDTQKSSAEVPIPVTGSHLPDIVMPDEINLESTPRNAVKSGPPEIKKPNFPIIPEAPAAQVPTKTEQPSAAPAPVVAPSPAAPTDEKSVKVESGSVAPAAGNAPAKALADPVAGADKPATTTTTTTTVEIVKSNRNEIDDEEMESVYAPPTIEGYSGWKKNKVCKAQTQLIDNDMIGIPDRWRIGIPKDSRHVKGNLWNPYRQNMIKGDYPIIGQSIFLDATFTSDSLIEGHSTPTPSGVSSQRPGSFAFFGRPDAFIYEQNFEISLELFKGETDFKPREWEVRMTPVFNVNTANLQENFAVNIDPRRGDVRFDHQITFNEAFGEYHLADLSPNYDFIANRTGIQFFNEDFRGFLFADNNLGTRFFGNLESNRLQYNLAFFEELAKDTNSDLNEFEFKDQHVVLGNIIRQDTFWKGFNVIGNFAFSDEETSREYNSNGVIVKPAPIGDLHTHANKVYYVGAGSDGHIGHWNITNQFYHAMGTDTDNNLAGKRLTINANMYASETSYDMDWMRFRYSYFYASGDHNTFDHKAGGFDSIFDDPNFAGGQFSYWVRQGFGAGNALTGLKNRGSLLPSLNTSKGEGERNFVNPGLNLYNIGYDAELTQKLKAVINVNYLRFDNTSSLEELLHQNNMSRNIGVDSSLGMIYRPWLNNQVIINAGVSCLTPSQGFKDIYSPKTLYAGFMGITLRY